MTPERWKRTEQLYHAALALHSDERRAFLVASCPDDEPLRRDVESLLNESPSGDGFLEAAAIHVSAITATEMSVAEMTGRTLGGYQLLVLLGAGGMGEVYRARDETLGREVAIKILPRALTSQPERLARFEREARILASLNHPNICTIYGLDQADGLRFLVLELVDGETLAQRLGAASKGSGRPLDLDEVLAFAHQIAAALEAAHEKGVVHRDLKPANVAIASGGVIKVLDFGLAKAAPAADLSPSEPGREDEPFGDRDLTREGLVIGTASYMSPEQACGKPVDRRTDAWAFGCVVFEMLSGRRPFSGGTFSETLASVLKTEPDWSELPATIPARLRSLLRRCLEKDPRRRLQAIGEARIVIEDLLNGVPEIPAGLLADARPRRGPGWIAAAVVSAIAATAAWSLKPVPSPDIVRLGLTLDSGPQLDGSGGGHILAISPDGARMVFVGTPLRLYLRSMDSADVRPIPGTDGYRSVREPVFSPDGQSVAFFAESTIKRVAIGGGSAVTICPATNPYGMSWGPDGIVFGQGGQGILRVAPTSGAIPTVLVRAEPGEVAHGPQVLPGGTAVLFTLARGDAADRWDKAQIVVQSLTSPQRTRLAIAGSDARYLPTGHIVYAVGGQLLAVAVDLTPPMVTSDPVPILGEGVRRSAGNHTGAVNAATSSAGGSLIYVPGPLAASYDLIEIAMVDPASGTVQTLNLPPRRYTFPRFSPDGTHIAFGIDTGTEATIWSYDLAGTSLMQPITGKGKNRFPVWTSNNTVAFQSDRDGDIAIFQQAANGTGIAERLTKSNPGTAYAPESWTGASNTLIYSAVKGSDVSLWTLSLSDKTATPFDAFPTPNASGAAFSPDGRMVAYSSLERGKTTVYVQPFPATGDRYQLTATGGDGPHGAVWSPNGKTLFYNPRAGGFERVTVTTNPFRFGNPVAVARKLQMFPPGSRTNYDVRSTDGKFVGLISSGQTAYDVGSDVDIQVVLGFFEDLKARVPRR